MEYLNEFRDYKSKNKTALTLGKFDGFHRGHYMLINKIKEHSTAEMDSLLLAFDIGGKGLLTREEQRDKMMDEVDVFISCPLLDEIKKMSPKKFVEEVLVKKLNVKYMVVGTDFQFGHGRRGDISLLSEFSKQFGFQLEVIPKLTDNGKIISSTGIREALEKGEIKRANHLLGYDYEISGLVKEGKKLGRALGFPTLNITPNKDKVIPKYGVYGCRIEIEESKSIPSKTGLHGEWKEYEGICNIGIKPTAVETGKVMAEVHVFDFQREVYGQRAKVKLLTFVRPEKKFSSTRELKKQIEQDVAYIKENKCTETRH
jgi:riboflavin kinase/FMN adenylyltransferase